MQRNNNTLQVFHSDPGELTISAISDDGDVISIQLFPDEIENLILNLSFNLAALKGYTPDMFDDPHQKRWAKNG